MEFSWVFESYDTTVLFDHKRCDWNKVKVNPFSVVENIRTIKGKAVTAAEIIKAFEEITSWLTIILGI